MSNEEYLKIVSSFADALKLNINNDDEFDIEAQKQIKERDVQYSELLKHYVETTKNRNDSKEKYKWIYFKIILGLLIVFIILLIIIIIVLLTKCTPEQLVSATPVFITAIAGFASSIIAIPLAVTKYLFSTEEDKYITDIISHTQEHDLSNRKILKAIAETVMTENKTA